MPRIDSPRRRERRTRSRSYSPRPSFSRRRSGSRSPRETRRSRSPEWRQSPRRRSTQEWKQRSRSPQRRSRSPQRRSRSPQRRSRSPQRRSRSLSYERSQPVKRVAAADSSGKRVSSYRSRSPSPVHAKRARDDREYREPRRDDRRYSPVRSQERDYSPRRRSPRGRSPSPRRVSRGRSPSPPKASRGRSPSPRYSGKLYSDKASSSRAPEKKRNTISSVTIPMKNRLEKLDKRFQTLEQISRGAFDFEENITIGIHRGPHHVNLDDEDIEVNYDFNPKTFLMLFPKKETFKAIFDRDEILQFHHDDILDEEAYVEKRTITVKPTDKPKPKWSDSVDYKITIGGRSSRAENYESDRRMVRDSGRRRSSRDREPEVTVRLDPKPDPRYERLFRASERRGDDRDEMIRDPHDLRHSLNKRHRDGYESDEGRDRDRSRDRDRGRSRDGDRDRGRDRDREDRIVVQDARRKIEARRSIQGGSLDRAEIQITKTERREMRRSVERLKREKGRASLEKELPDFKNRPVEPLIKPNIWIIGTSVVKDVAKEVSEGPIGKNLGLDEEVASIYWHGEADMTIKDILAAVTFMMKKYEQAQMIIIQCGDNDICEGINSSNYHVMQKDLKVIQEKIPGVRLVWSQLLPPWNREDVQVSSLNKSKRRINRYMVRAFYDFDGCYLRHPNFTNDVKMQLFRSDTDNYMHLSELGTQQYVAQLREGIKYFIAGMGNLFPYIETWPPENNTMQSLHPNQIPCLSYLQIRDLTKNLIKSMTPEQIAKLTGEQIEWLGPNQLTHMNIHTIKAFTPAQVPCFSRRQIMQFQLKQLELFSKEQIQNCTDNQKSLIIDQMKVKIQEEADIRSLVPIDMVPIDMIS